MPRPRAAFARLEDGFGLIEVVVALTILMGIAVPMSYLLGAVVQQTGDARASVAAGLIAEQQLEEAHSVLSAAMTAGVSSVCTPPHGNSPDLPCTIPQPNQTVQGFSYGIDLYFQWTSISGSADVCTSGQVPQVVLATVTVSWGPSQHSVTQSSVVNLPYTATNPTYGFLAVQVNDSGGDGTQGVTVTATNPSNGTTNVALTDSHGCAFLTVPNLSPGYTVTLSPPPNNGSVVYVDTTNNPSPSQSNVAVASQGVDPISFQYDEAATIDLTYPSTTGVGDGVTCPTANFCIATGQKQTTTSSGSTFVNGVPTGEILVTDDGNDWRNVNVPGLAHLLSVSCPSSTSCEGVGTSTSGGGLAFGATISGNSWTITVQSLPGGVAVSALSSVACPLSTQCYAVGYGVTGSVRSGVMLAYNGTTWTTVTTSGVEQITSIACPSSTTCILDANNTASPMPAPVLYSFATATSVFAQITLVPTPATLTGVTCGPGTSGLCLVDGATVSGAEVYVSGDSGTTWTAVTGMPTGTSTLGSPVCTTASACIVADNVAGSSAGAGVPPLGQLLDLTAAPGPPITWAASAASLPAGVLAVNDVACSSATNCVAAGQGGSPAQGVLLSSSDGGHTWSTTSLPGSVTPTFLSGVGCLASTCVASGESTTGDVTYGIQGGSWQTISLPSQGSGVTGLLGAGWSATVGNTNLKPNQFLEVVPAASAPVTAASPDPFVLTPLFPWTAGYTVWPGGCAAETFSPPVIDATPGGTSTVTAVLAATAFEIVDGTGQPVPGATLTLTETNAPSSACPSETFAMPTTSADGLSRAGFSYGSYTLSIVNPLDGKTTTTGVTVGASSVSVGSAVYPQGDPVVVSVQ